MIAKPFRSDLSWRIPLHALCGPGFFVIVDANDKEFCRVIGKHEETVEEAKERTRLIVNALNNYQE